MRNIKKIVSVCLFVTCMGIGLVFTSFIPGNACIEEVHSIYKKMTLDDLEKGNVYMNYTQITHFKQKQPSDPEQSKTIIECVIGKHQVHYKSNEISVYTDSIDNFTVLPIRKTVFWSSSLMEQGKEKRVKGFNLLQDSLFFVCRLISCRQQYNVEEGYNKVVEMEPEPRALKLFQYRKLVFYLNTETQSIKKVYIEFLPKSDYESIELIYNKLELNYQKENLKKPVKTLFVSADNKLKGSYKDYKLVDNRVAASESLKKKK